MPLHFQLPGMLAWAWLLVPVLLLFLVRRRPRRVRVSTLVFFKSLAQVYSETPWIRRLKKWLAAALAVATVLLGVFALARLVLAPSDGSLKSVVIVVDGSASMAAEDGDGTTRLAVARRRVTERLAGLQTGVGVLVMRYDRRAEILLPRSIDRREVRRALDRIGTRPVEGDAESALHLAARLAALNPPAAIWHVTDTPPDAPPSVDAAADPAAARDAGLVPTRLPEGVVLETVNVGLPAPVNVGITAFQVRPKPLEHGQFDAFVGLHAQAPEALEVQLEVRLDDQLVSIRTLTIEPGGTERLLVPVEAGRGAVLTVSAKAAGDALPQDDTVKARIPEANPIRLLWVRAADRADPFTQLALVALGEEGVLEAFEANPDAWPPKEEIYDVVLFDGWLPETWPADVPALVINPPGSAGPVRAAPIEGAGLPLEGLRAVDERHPVLFGVANDRVALTQTAVLEVQTSLAPLWVGDMGPLLVAGEVKGQRLVVMAFVAERSERLGLMASYPLLLGNAVFWLAQREDRNGSNRRTGDVVATDGGTLVWEGAAPVTDDAARATGGEVVELDRIGLWKIGALHGSASLLSKKESLLTPNTLGDRAYAGARGGLGGDLRPLLLWILLGLLILEAWLFHRYAVY